MDVAHKDMGESVNNKIVACGFVKHKTIITVTYCNNSFATINILVSNVCVDSYKFNP